MTNVEMSLGLSGATFGNPIASVSTNRGTGDHLE